uniref:Uncharacterized protein n=1 Tax=Pseudo-nitzschia australis TaxID=44445 RepID=A0A7S4AEV8_9STRA
MPVYGQATEFNERLSSLMSSVLYNTNHLYSAHHHPVHTASSYRERPLFADAILRKAAALRALQERSSSMADTTTTTTATTWISIQVVLVEEIDDGCSHDSAYSRSLADFVAQLFSMPQDGGGNSFRLQVVTVRSHSIRNDLIAAEPYGASPFGASKQRQRRVFVALGSAIRSLSQYLLLGEAETMALRQQQETTTHGLQQLQQFSGIVCVDPPPHLWNTFGRSMLQQTCRGKIPLLVVGYEDDSDNELNSNGNGRGDLLRDFRSHPQAMVVIARASARVGERRGNNDSDSGSSSSRSNNNNNNVASTNGENRTDACFWLARLIIVYAQALQRLKTPPGKSIHHPIARSNHDCGLPAKSKL